MEGELYIPYKPRSIKNDVAEAAVSLCERTVSILKPVILKALEPFPEASHALSLALFEFARKPALP